MRHLVLADDSTTIQKVIQLSFADEEFEIHTFSNGTGALEFLRNYGSDIVLADISLPHLDGYDLCREIRQDPRTSGLPVVLLAGTFEPFDAERAQEVGYTSLLVKPFETGRLVDLVKKLAIREVKAKTVEAIEEDVPVVAEVDEENQDPEFEDQHPPIEVPLPRVEGEILFELSPDQCRVEGTPSSSADLGSPEVVPALSTQQVDELVRKVIERLPGTLRALIPDIAKEVLNTPTPGSCKVSDGS